MRKPSVPSIPIDYSHAHARTRESGPTTLSISYNVLRVYVEPLGFAGTVGFCLCMREMAA